MGAKKQITLQDVRRVLEKYFPETGVESMSDEQLLNANTASDLGLDSLDIVEVEMFLEDQLGIGVSDAALEYDLPTVGELIQTCNENLI